MSKVPASSGLSGFDSAYRRGDCKGASVEGYHKEAYVEEHYERACVGRQYSQVTPRILSEVDIAYGSTADKSSKAGMHRSTTRIGDSNVLHDLYLFPSTFSFLGRALAG